MTTVKSFLRKTSISRADLTEERLLDRPPIRIPASAATFEGFNDWALAVLGADHIRPRFLVDKLFIEIYPGFYAFEIPTSAVASAEGFCKWMASDAVPIWGRFAYINNEVVVDVSPEEIETHDKVKTAVTVALGALNQELDLGEFYSDGVLLADLETGMSTAADATFVSWRSFKTRRVRLVPRKKRPGQYVRVEGGPDWILEILSMWSASADPEEMRELYHRIKVREYWIIDARGADIVFQILVRRKKGFVAVRSVGGWHKSAVFGRSFRLTRKRHHMGLLKYKLEVRPA